MLKKITLLYFCLVVVLVSCNPFEGLQKGKLNKVKETGLEMKSNIPASFFPQDLHIVAAGDSLTQGVGDSSDSGGYIPYLAEMLEQENSIKNANFENFGVRGNRADQLLSRLESEKLQSSIKEADLIILTIGGNDLMKVVKENISNLKINLFRSEQELFQDSLKEIFSKIREQNPNAPIILIGLYNPFYYWFADVKEMNYIVDEWNTKSRLTVENDKNAFLVDIHDIFLNNEEDLLYTDYFHPNDRGYELIADRVYELLDQEIIDSLHN